MSLALAPMLCCSLMRDCLESSRDGLQLFCACDPCLLFKFDDCVMKHAVGKMVRVTAPIGGARLRRPQMERLLEWSTTLAAKMLVGVNADTSDAEGNDEGGYWLALLTGPAFVIPEDLVRGGQQYRQGWLVAPARWYILRQRSQRGYELLEETVWIVVSHMIRLRGLKFTRTQAGPQDRTFRSGSGLSFLCEDMHNEILSAIGADVANEAGEAEAAEAEAAEAVAAAAGASDATAAAADADADAAAAGEVAPPNAPPAGVGRGRGRGSRGGSRGGSSMSSSRGGSSSSRGSIGKGSRGRGRGRGRR